MRGKDETHRRSFPQGPTPVARFRRQLGDDAAARRGSKHSHREYLRGFRLGWLGERVGSRRIRRRGCALWPARSREVGRNVNLATGEVGGSEETRRRASSSRGMTYCFLHMLCDSCSVGEEQASSMHPLEDRESLRGLTGGHRGGRREVDVKTKFKSRWEGLVGEGDGCPGHARRRWRIVASGMQIGGDALLFFKLSPRNSKLGVK